jgi:hypothetical protein
MIYATRGCHTPDWARHDPTLHNYYDETIAEIYEKHDCDVPRWTRCYEDEDDNMIADD